MDHIVVVGAGVAGLTSALLLLEKGYKVHIVAKHTPGDLSIEYTSPWAGANVLTFANRSTRESDYDRITYPFFKNLAYNEPKAGIIPKEWRSFVLRKDLDKNNSPLEPHLCDENPPVSEWADNFKILDKSEFPKTMDIAFASSWSSFCIHTGIYLNYLLSQCLSKGGQIHKRSLNHINELQSIVGFKPSVIINCTGLLASKIGGIKDDKVIPIRGQTILVRNSLPFMAGVSSNPYSDEPWDGHPDEHLYIMTRLDGSTILGGCFQYNSWSADVDDNLAERIIKRTTTAFPQLTNYGKIPLDIVRHNVGLRPGRIGGPRLEIEHDNDIGIKIVHNYGAGGAGYQSSYGMASKVVELVDSLHLPATSRL